VGCREQASVSVAKHQPANVVAAGLVLEDQAVKAGGDLPALPVTLCKAPHLFLARRCGGLNCLDGVGGGTEVVFGDVGNAGCLCPAAYAANRAAPRRGRAAPMAWPPTARVAIIAVCPRDHARAASIALRGRTS